MYHAFYPTEMEILAGFIYGCQYVQVPHREKGNDNKMVITGYDLIPIPALLKESDLVRPYTPLERFLEAVKVFVVAKGVKFGNCKYHANTNTVETVGRMDNKQEEASRRIFEAIKNWDEQILSALYEKHRATLESEKLGFKPSKAAPLSIEHSISELTDLAQEKHVLDETTASGLSFNEEPTLSTNVPLTTEVAQPEGKRRGMPKGGWPKKDK